MKVYENNGAIAIGDEIGRWTVVDLKRLVDVRGRKRKYAICKCECGRKRNVLLYHLRNRATQSCGCLVREKHTTHGESSSRNKKETAEHSTWSGMIARCTNENSPGYNNYGGRGIHVCDRWLSYENFLEDMGRRPSPRHSIDRIDNDKGYSPDNCRWATQKEQCRNKRTNRLITANGETKTLAEWAEITGLRTGTISERLRHGWSPESAVLEPLKIIRKKKCSPDPSQPSPC